MKPVADSEDCDGFAARVTLTWGLELDSSSPIRT